MRSSTVLVIAAAVVAPALVSALPTPQIGFLDVRQIANTHGGQRPDVSHESHHGLHRTNGGMQHEALARPHGEGRQHGIKQYKGAEQEHHYPKQYSQGHAARSAEQYGQHSQSDGRQHDQHRFSQGHAAGGAKQYGQHSESDGRQHDQHRSSQGRTARSDEQSGQHLESNGRQHDQHRFSHEQTEGEHHRFHGEHKPEQSVNGTQSSSTTSKVARRAEWYGERLEGHEGHHSEHRFSQEGERHRFHDEHRFAKESERHRFHDQQRLATGDHHHFHGAEEASGRERYSHSAREDQSEAISLSGLWDAAKDVYTIGKDGYDAYEAGKNAYNSIKGNSRREMQAGGYRMGEGRPHRFAKGMREGGHRYGSYSQRPTHSYSASAARPEAHTARANSEAISLSGAWDAAKDVYTIGKDGYDAYEAGKNAYNSIKGNSRRELLELLAREAESDAISLSGLWDAAKDVYTIGKDGYDAYEAGKNAYNSIKSSRSLLDELD
ncbi:uncharacterized protein LAESUDRAFT_712843 [Laetiporus sulphureus 93-53]|uniref:Uncharacterized protein n=1 Tax=Laetiporus sulphureus 93-53 TaxID=1314785 RepID=A0A165FDT4_9APHY|nr:uncharacterized protein LAESUDRAFT_712843 [Laetiporus sulphureus 93-53]KZT08818.1 hypothetical protein LAESUDRAFT_712843 [Laetiporus sulphureus 93-53]